MQKPQKTNQLSIIIAKKGSGKSYFAIALSLAQPKRVFWITPLKNGSVMLPCDTQENISITTPAHLSTTHILSNRDNIDDKLERVQNIAYNIGGAYLVIDELDYYANSRLYHQSKIFEIINYGRHLNLDIVFIARRLQDIPKNTITNADFFYLGRNNNAQNDIKYYKDFLQNDIILKSESLAVGEFIRYDTNLNKVDFLRLTRDNFQRIENARLN